jgi:hypothetical protein
MAIILVGDQTPSHPDSFERQLQAYDRDLVVVWHKPPHWPKKKPGVWKIEQCVRHIGGFHEDGRPKHTHVCQRTYVLMVQDDDGTPIPLGEHVIEKLKAMRAYSEKFGGETERGLRNFVKDSNNIDAELEARREAARLDMLAHNRKFNRRQFNQFYNLVERHDMRPNR